MNGLVGVEARVLVIINGLVMGRLHMLVNLISLSMHVPYVEIDTTSSAESIVPDIRFTW